MPLLVYISTAGSNEIFVLEMNRASGELSPPLQTVSLTATTGRGPESVDLESVPLAITPDRRFLYAALRYEPFTVVSFAVDTTSGRLTHLASGPIAHSMAYISTDRSGRFLLGASYPGNLLSINAIDPRGIVSQRPHQVLPFKANAHSVLLDRDNCHVYAAILGQDAIIWLPFDAESGRVSAQSQSRISFAPGLGPRHFRFHPNNKFLYADTEQGGTVNAYRFDPDAKQWLEIQTMSAMPEDFHGIASAADLQITPDGRFVYVSERSHDAIVGFAIDDASGKLLPVGRFPTEKKPRSFAIDPGGRFMVVAGQSSHHASVYAIDGSNGTLTRRFRSPMGRTPSWVEIVDFPAQSGARS